VPSHLSSKHWQDIPYNLSYSRSMELTPRKRRKSFDIEGHAHELTFSTYRRRPFLNEPYSRKLLLQSISKARAKWKFQLWAYVIMPEHVHLLVWPGEHRARVQDILRTIKQPVGQKVIGMLRHSGNPALSDMAKHLPDGVAEYAFWQAGGGYDRNLYTPKAIWNAIEYIHLNPVRRGLVERPEDWPWSSCRFYRELPPYEIDVDRCEVWNW
jgi:putative transposase